MWLNISATMPTRTLADTVLPRFPEIGLSRLHVPPKTGKHETLEATLWHRSRRSPTDIRSKFCCGRQTVGLISDLRHLLGLKRRRSEPSPVVPSQVATPGIPKHVNRENMEARKPGFVKSSYPYFQIARDTGWVISVGLLVPAADASGPLRGRGGPQTSAAGSSNWRGLVQKIS